MSFLRGQNVNVDFTEGGGRDRVFSLYSDMLQAGRTGDGSPVDGEIFRVRPDQPWGLPSFLYNGYKALPGGKAAGRCWQPSHFKRWACESVGVITPHPVPADASWSKFRLAFKKIILQWKAEKFTSHRPANSEPAHVFITEATWKNARNCLWIKLYFTGD